MRKTSIWSGPKNGEQPKKPTWMIVVQLAKVERDLAVIRDKLATSKVFHLADAEPSRN